jgi:hypothetical protein
MQTIHRAGYAGLLLTVLVVPVLAGLMTAGAAAAAKELAANR